MNKKLLLFFSVLLMVFHAAAQVLDSSAQWTWMKGGSAVLQVASYGTTGQEDIANTPGAHGQCAYWKDKQGNFWVFGGQGYGQSTSTSGDHNDLWKYNPTTNNWTFIGGAKTANNAGVYGTRLQADPANWPGGRRTPDFWTDTAGNFWLFGGMGYATTTGGTELYLSDLWKYNPVAGLWTWVSGNKTGNTPGIYGTKRQASATNMPGGRGNGRGAVWIDSANNMWFFGGYGYASTGTLGRLSDLWKYDPVADMWTWMSGNDVVEKYGVYGTPGVESSTIYPGAAAHITTTWTDKAGNLWFFGGLSIGATTAVAPISHMWRYNVYTNNWTYIKGATETTPASNSAVFGTRGVAATGNWPGGRYGGTSWQDVQGNIWVQGGYGYNAATTQGYLNDLWKYDPVANQWTWMRGKTVINSVGTYGTVTVQDVLNGPGGKSNCAGWVDGSGNFWLFGGTGYGASGSANNMNDMWRLLQPPGCPVTANVTVVKPTTFCAGDSVILIANAGAGYIYQWSNTSGTISGAMDDSLIVKTAGTYTVSVSDGSCSKVSATTVVTVNTLPTINITPATAVICNGKDTALTADGGASYTWLPNTYTGSGATVRANPTGTTTYTVTGTDGNGCKNTATRTVTVNTLPNITISPATAVICSGKDTALTAGNGTTYTWLPNTYTGSGATIRANATGTTTYTVTGTDANGCSNTATRIVTVNALPNITISPATAVICSGKDTALTASNGTTYTWLPNNYTGSGATIRANPTALTTYTVTGTDANGCVNTATRIVTVNTLPNISITPATAVICNGKDTALTGNGGTTYTWLPNTYTGSGATIRANATGTTTYTVTGTNANGCQSTATRTVTVNTLPTVSITGNSAVCPNATLSLTGNPSSGTWSSGTTMVATVNQSGTVTGQAMAGGTSVITYVVTDANNCVGTATKTITVNAAPATPNPISGKPNICIGDSSLLTNTTTGGTWSSGTTSVATIASTGWVKSVGVGTSMITYTVTNANSCINSISTPVTVYALPAAPSAITGKLAICEGENAALASTPTGGVWASSDVNIGRVDAGSGLATGRRNGNATITYTITDGNGCSNFTTASITVNANPVVTITPAGKVGFCEGDSVVLTAGGTAANWMLQWGDLTGEIQSATKGSYAAKTAGYYWVRATDANGCKDTSDVDTVIVHTVATPVITRNGQTLSTGTGYTSYQWYSGGQMVNGATQSSCIVTQNGIYHVVVMDSNGCSKASIPDTVTDLAVTVINSNTPDIRIYPNPANTIVNILSSIAVNIELFSIDGKMVLQQSNAKAIDVNSLPVGVYMMRIMDKNGVFIKTEKLLKGAY